MLAVFGAAFAIAGILGRRVLWLLRGPKSDYATHVQKLPQSAYEGKTCWITGASGGIGAALAREITKRGGNVVLSARRGDALAAVAASLPCASDKVHVLPVDLAQSSAKEIRAVAMEAIAAFGGRLDYLFNNAGVSTRATADTFHEDNLESLMHLNFLAPTYLTQACLPALRASEGVVVNTSSIASIVSTPLRSAYCASKAALSRWHACLALEERGVVAFVNVCPGSVQTDIARNAMTGEKGGRFESSDPNIDEGLAVEYAAERMVAAAYGRLQEVWIAKGREYLGTNLAYYLPGLWARISPRVSRKYARDILNARQRDAKKD